MKKRIAALCLLTSLCSALLSATASAWDGYDWDNSADITIESGNLVRQGQEIEYYDWGKSEYRYGEVDRIQRYGSTVEIEVYDYDEGEYRVFEMYD